MLSSQELYGWVFYLLKSQNGNMEELQLKGQTHALPVGLSFSLLVGLILAKIRRELSTALEHKDQLFDSDSYLGC